MFEPLFRVCVFACVAGRCSACTRPGCCLQDLSSRAQGKPADEADDMSGASNPNDDETSSNSVALPDGYEDSHVPLIMQRPRSNSGSRFLSDKVQ